MTLTTLGGKLGRWSDSLHFTDEETEAPRVSDLLKDTMSKELGLPTDSKLHVLPLACTATVLHTPSQKDLCCRPCFREKSFQPSIVSL